MNCFGQAACDAGHSRVPAPPDKMTGYMVVEEEEEEMVKNP